MQNFTAVRIENPFEDTHEVLSSRAGLTIAQWLAHSGNDAIMRQAPYVILRNAEPVLEADFDTVIEPGDIITLVATPGIADWIVYAAIAVSVLSAAGSLYLALSAPAPENFSRDSTTYSLSYRGNRRKPGQPIPVLYGTMRVYPDITGSYTYYDGADQQWLVQLFDVTQGKASINIDDIFYEDTPITNFAERDIEVLWPGELSTIFPTEVYVSGEVSDIAQPDGALEYTAYYAACSPGERITSIDIDIAAPQGMYSVSTSGDLRGAGRKIWVRIQQINDAGTALGPPTEYSFKIGGEKTTRPQRWTKTFKGAAGRYQVALADNGAKDFRTRYSTQWVWTGMRGFSAEQSPPTTTTRIALRVRQSATLGTQTVTMFNALAKRWLPGYDGYSWLPEVQTNNLVSAFADALMADYGAGLPDTRLDLDHLYALSQRSLAVFNGLFDTEMNLWEVLEHICRPLLARPLELPGGIYTIVTDDPPTAPSAMFTMRNIVAGSFSIQHRGKLEQAYDSVQVTFSNSAEDYRQTSLMCVPSGEPGDHPEEIDVIGVTTAAAAYEVGIRRANESKWRRKLIEFETGIEGYIPHYGDTIRVHHFLLGLEQATPSISGEAKAWSSGSKQLTVFEDLTALVSVTGLQIWLRQPDGVPFGPITASVPNASTITITGSVSGWTPAFSDTHAGPLYCIGKVTDFMAECKVTGIEQTAAGRIKVRSVVDSPNVYIKGGVPSWSPIELPNHLFPKISALTWNIYGTADNFRLQISWRGENADYFVVQESLDGGATWDEVATTTALAVTVTPPALAAYQVRVSGVSIYQGAWAYLTINTQNYSLTPPPMTGLRLRAPFTGMALQLAWDTPQHGFHPRFQVAWNGSVKATYLLDAGTSRASLSFRDIRAVETVTEDGVTFTPNGSRTLTIYGYLRSKSGHLSDTPAVLTAKNPQIGVLQNAYWRERGSDLNITFDIPEDGDGEYCEVHYSTTPGFTPGPGTLFGRYGSNDINLIGVLDYSTTYYMRIGGHDVWGRDGMIYSDEAVITTSDEVIEGSIDYSQITGSKPPVDATRNIMWYQATPPPSGSNGDYWYSTTLGRLHQWVGGAWVAVSTNVKSFSQSQPPANPADSLAAGDFWFDTDSTTDSLYRWNGTAWVLVATNGASWTEIDGKPVDSDLLNTLQEWDDIRDSYNTKPADKATKNRIYYTSSGGTPILSALQVQYQLAEASSGTSPSTTADSSGKGDNLTLSGSVWRWASSGGGKAVEFYGGSYSHTSYAGKRIDQGTFGPAMNGKTKFSAILVTNNVTGPAAYANIFGLYKTAQVMYGEWAVVADNTGRIGVVWGGSAQHAMSHSAGINSGRHVWHIVMDITNATAANRCKVYKNGVLLTGATLATGTTPPNYTSAECWMMIGRGYATGQAIQGSVCYAAIYDGTLTTQQIADSYNALAASDDASLLSASGGSAPAGENGDIWYDPSTEILQQHNGTAWVPIGNDFRDTLKLADGAGLGETADWGQIFGTGKPADNATVNNIYYSPTNPGTPANGDLWYESDVGFLWKGVGGAWQKVATNTTIYRSNTAPSNPNIGDLWYDTDDTEKPLYRYDTDGWKKIATDGALWDNIPDKPELSPPLGDKGSLFVDGTLDKTGDAGDTNLNRYFVYIGNSVNSRLYTDTTQRAFDIRAEGSGSNQGVGDKNLYKVSPGQYLFYSARFLKGGTIAGTSPQVRVGGEIFNKSGVSLGKHWKAIQLSAISNTNWQWEHRSFQVTFANAFAIRPTLEIAQATSGTIYVDDLYLGYAPARISNDDLPAFMQALTVDTLYIKDQAVTQPVWGYAEWASPFNAVTAPANQLVYKSVLSGPVTLSAAGIPVIMTISLEQAIEGVTQYTGSKYLRLKRNGTPIKTDRLFSHNSSPSVFIPGTAQTIFIDTGHSGGTVTYDVEIGVEGLPGASATFAIRSIALSLMEAKK